MLLLASFPVALALLLPVLLFVGLRSSADREPWQMALDISVALSLDLLIVLGLTWLMPLGAATFVSRVAYLVIGAAVLFFMRRGRLPRPRWPRAIGRSEIRLLATSVLVALAVSAWISRRWIIWDRGWHMPLVASLRGQTLPFRNIFNDSEVLHYHFSGDAQAAMIQSLSLGTFHSSLALSLMHDVHFMLTGLTLALFLVGWGYRRVGFYVLATLALLLTGPAHIFRGGARPPQEGYSLVSYLSFSFRPHTALAGLFVIAFVGAMMARLGGRDDLDWRKTAPSMCLIAAGLGITDEASMGMLGLALGLTWLYAPRVIHPRRVVGLLVFAALAAALILPNLAFKAGLSPGGEHHAFKLVPWRSPGYYRPPIPLTKPIGKLMFVFDTFALLSVGVGAVLHALLRRGRGRGILAAHFVTLVLLSLFALTRVDVDGQSLESHRFVIAAFITAPFVALAMASERFSPFSPMAKDRGKSIYAAALMVAGIGAAGASTWDWIFNYLPSWASRREDYDRGVYDPYAINCRAMMGSSAGALTRPTYVSRWIYFAATGCIPTFTPGYISGNAWKSITIGLPYSGKEALSRIRKETPAGASIPLVCPVVPDRTDTVCAAAEATGSCKVVGSVAKACQLTAAQAAQLAP